MWLEKLPGMYRGGCRAGFVTVLRAVNEDLLTVTHAGSAEVWVHNNWLTITV